MTRHFVILGNAVNVAWSLYDAARKVSSFTNCFKDSKDLIMLWGFAERKDFETINEGDRILVYAQKSNTKISRGGFIALGTVFKKLEDERTDIYWPYPHEGKKGKDEWPYRFYIKLNAILSDILNSLRSSLVTPPYVNRETSISELNNLIKPWILLPCSSFEGSLGKSLVEVEYPEIFNALAEKIIEKARIIPLHHVFEVLWSSKQVKKLLEETGLIIPEEKIRAIIAALNAGKHVILVGPPGTGKTTLASIIAKAHQLEEVMRTATSEWTRADVIGGPAFVGRDVIWKSGCLVEAIARYYSPSSNYRGSLLIIDELNRANLDRAFGEFFTIFGLSDPKEWEIPKNVMCEIEEYGDKTDRWAKTILALWRDYKGSRGGLKVPEGFRVIGTMNTYDRRYLFSLGYALLRRFVIVDIQNPPEDRIKKLLLRELGHSKNSEEIVNELINLIKSSEIELGIAVIVDCARLIRKSLEENASKKEALDEAVSALIIPQLEGQPLEKIRRFRELLEDKGFQESLRLIDEYFGEILYASE